MVNYVGISGRYRPHGEEKEYLYFGRFTAEYPSHWEAKVRRADDKVNDVLKEFRVELSGPLVDIETDSATLRAVTVGAIERAIDEWTSSGVIATWIDWTRG